MSDTEIDNAVISVDDKAPRPCRKRQKNPPDQPSWAYDYVDSPETLYLERLLKRTEQELEDTRHELQKRANTRIDFELKDIADKKKELSKAIEKVREHLRIVEKMEKDLGFLDAVMKKTIDEIISSTNEADLLVNME